MTPDGLRRLTEAARANETQFAVVGFLGGEAIGAWRYDATGNVLTLSNPNMLTDPPTQVAGEHIILMKFLRSMPRPQQPGR